MINYRVAFLAFAAVATLATISSFFMDYDVSIKTLYKTKFHAETKRDTFEVFI